MSESGFPPPAGGARKTAGAAWLGLFAILAGADAQPAGPDFFEMKIRPVLARNCFSCHTQSELGGLRLDSEERMLKGGKTGPAVVPHHADDSLLIQAVEQTHSRLKMPPQAKLNAEELADLRKWVDDGARWPARSAPKPASKRSITAEQRAFWSFQPVRRPAVPQTKDGKWAKTEIDRFLLERLEAKGLTPAKPAGKRTLIRRVTFDLTGLPPTPEEVNAFIEDRSANAFEKVVDRLLASPRYGERWARHWLDLARYSDGRQSARVDTPYPNAFRYRDWVIDAFNRDLPYDMFVKAQIAADLLPPEARESLLPGLGFQVIGESDEDRVDVNTRVFLGLTVGCAQCHDHKFDPIPTRDYYSLIGIFRSSEAVEHPLAGPEVVAAYEKAKKLSEQKQEELRLFLEKQTAQLTDILSAQTEQYVMAAWAVLSDPARQATEWAAKNDLDGPTLERWIRYLKVPERDHQAFACWDDLMRKAGSPGKASEPEVRGAARQMHAAVQSVLSEKKAMDDRNYVKLGGLEGMKNADRVIATLVEALPAGKTYLWRDLASKPYSGDSGKFVGGLYYYDAKDLERFLGSYWKKYLDHLRAEVKAAEKAAPAAYPYWHVLKDREKPVDARVAIRGDVSNPGEEAPRRFLAILSADEPAPFRKGSGRLELAEAIASAGNPLTARVMVNRIWKYHFGEGIVRSTSNFGQLGDRPTHPELLDYLASRFVESGWSMKAMHREMLLSAAYQMSSEEGPGAAADPENRLLSHANVVERMDAESLRDSVLAAAGTLDLATGGEPKPLTDQFLRRAIYATVSRSNTDRTMLVFDFPDPNSSSEQRITTVGPMQRLYFMNSKFVAQQSKALAERLFKETAQGKGDDRQRIARAYQILFGRPAGEEEIQLGLEFLESKEDAWPQYAQALLGTAEFSAIQ
jgi:hypothetical protein